MHCLYGDYRLMYQGNAPSSCLLPTHLHLPITMSLSSLSLHLSWLSSAVGLILHNSPSDRGQMVPKSDLISSHLIWSDLVWSGLISSHLIMRWAGPVRSWWAVPTARAHRWGEREWPRPQVAHSIDVDWSGPQVSAPVCPVRLFVCLFVCLYGQLAD